MTNIPLERSLLHGQGLEIRTREEWGSRLDYASARACEPRARRLFLHIALVNDPSDLTGPEDQVMRNIENIGQARFGVGCSYNAAAFNTGTLREGQPLTRRGAHTVNTYRRDTCPTHGGSLVAPNTSSGYNNNITDRALVLPQQLDDPVTDAQLDAAARWGAALRRAGLAEPHARWHGHRCVTAKGCPGQTAYDRIPELQQLTDYYTQNGLDAMQLTPDNIHQIRDAVWNQPLEADGRTARKMLRQASKAAGLADDLATRSSEILLHEPGTIAATFDATQIKDAVKQAFRELVEDD